MEATPRATSRARPNRGHPVVTRHGLRSPHAATPPLRRMPPSTPFAKTSANVLDISPGQIPILASPGEKSHSPSSRRFQPQPVPPSPQPSKIRNPHRPSPQPRGFVLGRFPYAGPMPKRTTGDGRHPKTFTMSVASSLQLYSQDPIFDCRLAKICPRSRNLCPSGACCPKHRTSLYAYRQALVDCRYLHLRGARVPTQSGGRRGQ